MKGLAWGLFSGTATFSAFTLPALIFSILNYNPFNGNDRLWYPPIWVAKIIAIIIIFCALYHSLYRVKTVTFDLGFSPKTVKITAFIANCLLTIGILATSALLILG